MEELTLKKFEEAAEKVKEATLPYIQRIFQQPDRQ